MVAPGGRLKAQRLTTRLASLRWTTCVHEFDVLHGDDGVVLDGARRRGPHRVVAVESDALLAEQRGNVGSRRAHDAQVPVDEDGDRHRGAVDDGLPVVERAGRVDAQRVLGGPREVPLGQQLVGVVGFGLDGLGEPVVDEGDVLGRSRHRRTRRPIWRPGRRPYRRRTE